MPLGKKLYPLGPLCLRVFPYYVLYRGHILGVACLSDKKRIYSLKTFFDSNQTMSRRVYL